MDGEKMSRNRQCIYTDPVDDLKARMTAASTLLAPYAVPHEGRLGRAVTEAEDTIRFPFQRDRDRIIHSQAFRRLQGKTQVFVAGEGDHYRTRLTHTMEVAQVARDLARAMRLNEDLAECIALAHDLGHPPFGHTGEDAIDAWMREQGLSFEHNEQSYRIVTLLEVHAPGVPGLNLQGEITEALRKHSTVPSTLEAALVNLADEIAYVSHDSEDGLAGNLFPREDLLRVPLARRAEELRSGRNTSISGALKRLLAEDLLEQARVSLRASGAKPDIRFSPDMSKNLALLRAFLMERMYSHPLIRVPADRGKEIVLLLCRAFATDPPEKILQLRHRTDGSLAEAVKDYVAGMTDAYAQSQAEALGLME